MTGATNYLRTKTDLTQEQVRNLFSYNPYTGELFWVKPRYKTMEGKQAGHSHNKGYRQVSIKEKEYLVHRVIWLLVHGEHPPEIDHINHNRSDNRLVNLRAVSRVGNQHNASRRADNTSGVSGVSYCARTKRWKARLQHDGVRRSLGYFESLGEAAEARRSAKHSLGEVR